MSREIWAVQTHKKPDENHGTYTCFKALADHAPEAALDMKILQVERQLIVSSLVMRIIPLLLKNFLVAGYPQHLFLIIIGTQANNSDKYIQIYRAGTEDFKEDTFQLTCGHLKLILYARNNAPVDRQDDPASEDWQLCLKPFPPHVSSPPG